MVKKSKKLIAQPEQEEEGGDGMDTYSLCLLKGNYSCLSGELIIAPRTRYDLAPNNTLRCFLTGCGAPTIRYNHDSHRAPPQLYPKSSPFRCSEDGWRRRPRQTNAEEQADMALPRDPDGWM